MMSPDENVGVMELETTYMGSIWHPLSSTVNPIVTATLQSRTLPSMEHRTERKRFTTDTSVWLKDLPSAVCSTQRSHHRQTAAPGGCVWDFSYTQEDNIAFFVVRQRYSGFTCIPMVTAMSVVSMPVTFPACKKFRQVFAMVHTVDGNWRKISKRCTKYS